jgi:hypothetical protein
MLHIQFENFTFFLAQVCAWCNFNSHDNPVVIDNLYSFINAKSDDTNVTATAKLTEEITYFDGDASAVTADLTHNVDVSKSFQSI